MLKISIDKILWKDRNSHYIKNRQYCVYLGNSSKSYFNNLKDAKAYLVSVNRFLNNSLHEINHIYSMTFYMYRKLWFYFDTPNDKKVCAFKNYSSEISSTFRQIDELFNRAVNYCRTTNGNYFTFNHLFSIIKSVMLILNRLMEVAEARKIYQFVYELNVYRIQVHRLQNRIESWGKDGFKELIPSEHYFEGLEQKSEFDFINDKKN